MEKIEKPLSLDERAYLNIKDAILKCVLPPGEFLAEVRLAQDLGVSKTPIRQAMARLQQEGFLETVPYKGHFVARISAVDITEIYGLRQILEGHLVRETARLFGPGELAAMEENIDAARQALADDNVEQYVLLNREFHHTFDRKYGHSRISDVLTNLDEHVQRIIFYAIQQDFYDLLTQQREDHRLIFKAIREGEVETAVLRMENHLAEFCDDLVVRLKRADKRT